MKVTPDVLARLRDAARELAELGIGVRETMTHWRGIPIEDLDMDQAANVLGWLCMQRDRVRAAKTDAPPPANVIPILPYRAARALRSPPL